MLAALLCLADCGAKQASPSWQEQFNPDVRYLSKSNYEEAFLTFEAAIKIDSKRPESYAGLTDAYLATGDENLSGRLKELRSPVTSQPSSSPA